MCLNGWSAYNTHCVSLGLASRYLLRCILIQFFKTPNFLTVIKKKLCLLWHFQGTEFKTNAVNYISNMFQEEKLKLIQTLGTFEILEKLEILTTITSNIFVTQKTKFFSTYFWCMLLKQKVYRQNKALPCSYCILRYVNDFGRIGIFSSYIYLHQFCIEISYHIDLF